MKSILKLFPIFGVLFFFNCQGDSGASNSYESASAPKKELTEEELQQQLHDTECSKPAEYIHGTLKALPRYKGVFSLKVNGMKLNFNLSSSATLATIKDIKIRVNFLSKTRASVMKKTLVVYEFIKPGGSINYKTEIDCSNQQWNDIKDWEWEVIDSDCH